MQIADMTCHANFIVCCHITAMFVCALSCFDLVLRLMLKLPYSHDPTAANKPCLTSKCLFVQKLVVHWQDSCTWVAWWSAMPLLAVDSAKNPFFALNIYLSAHRLVVPLSYLKMFICLPPFCWDLRMHMWLCMQCMMVQRVHGSATPLL